MKKHITSFYAETLILILVFVAVILTLTQVFGLAKKQSEEAKLLTSAVTLAQNAAEALSVSASDSGTASVSCPETKVASPRSFVPAGSILSASKVSKLPAYFQFSATAVQTSATIVATTALRFHLDFIAFFLLQTITDILPRPPGSRAARSAP